MSIYGLLGHVKNQREQAHRPFHVEPNEDTIKPMGDYRIIITQKGSCNQQFFNEITQFGNIHNGYVKMDKHNQITSSRWHGAMTIDETENYDKIKLTMETLGSDITKEKDKYKYNGQAIHSLAYAYYTHNYDRQIVSKCSPQVYGISTKQI